MEVLRFDKFALVLSLSLFFTPKTLSIIIARDSENRIQNLEITSAPSVPELNNTLLYMYSRECCSRNEDCLKLRSILDKMYAETGLKMFDRSIKLNFFDINSVKLETSGECWWCLGKLHFKQIQYNRHNNKKKVKKVYLESYECAKHQVVLKLLMEHSKIAASNFVKLCYEYKNRTEALIQPQNLGNRTKAPENHERVNIFKKNGKTYKNIRMGK